MDTTAIIVALVGGAAGIITAIKGVLEYIDKRKGNTVEAQVQRAIEPLLKKIDALEEHSRRQDEQLQQIYLDTTRTQLYFKMEHDTHNYDTILKIAYRYFVELHGDWVATVDFLNWAKKENIEVPQSILDAIAKNDGKKAVEDL